MQGVNEAEDMKRHFFENLKRAYDDDGAFESVDGQPCDSKAMWKKRFAKAYKEYVDISMRHDRAYSNVEKAATHRARSTTSDRAGYWTFNVMVIMLFVAYIGLITRDRWYDAKPDESLCGRYDQLRCHNDGTPVDAGESFVCACPDGFYGEHCDEETLFSSIYRWMSSALLSFRPKTTVALYQDHLKRLTNAFSALDRSTAGNDDGPELADAMTRTRILPANPRSLYCSPDENMPSLQSVYLQVSQKRKADRRSPNAFARHSKNALHTAFYQYFVLQFFGDDFNSTVTGSQLYGADEKTQSELRSFVGGKLNAEILNGEQYLPVSPWSQRLEAFADTRPHWSDRVQTTSLFDGPWMAAITRIYGVFIGNPRRAAGHRLVAADPVLFGVSTLWLREHNRICDALANLWPEWNDEELYVTAKRTVVGEMMAMMTNDVLRSREHELPATKYDPETWRDHVQNDLGSVSTPFELLLAAMLPGNFENANATAAFHGDGDGLENLIANDAKSLAIDLKIGSAATTTTTTEWTMARVLMTLARENSAQNLNAYRRHFGLGAYESFVELTAGDRDAADALESLYGHVDAVELVPGMMAERTDRTDGVAPAFQLTTKSFIMNAIMTNPLNGRDLWRPETFGGDGGFDAVKSADVASFVRRNINDQQRTDEFLADEDAQLLVYV